MLSFSPSPKTSTANDQEPPAIPERSRRSSRQRPRSALRWATSDHRLHVLEGDCLLLLRELAAESVDVVVTSPPYNIGLEYNAYRDSLPHNAYMTWLVRVAEELKRVLARDGSFFLNVGGTNVDPWKPMEIALQIRQVFALQNHIVWAKSLSVGQDSFGHFKPINSGRFLNNTFEHVFHFTKTGDARIDRLAVGVPYKHKSNIARFGHDRDRRCSGNVWFVPYKTVQSKSGKFNHPGTYPVELAKRCIQLHGERAQTVLDPFLGTGTTLIAAQELGRRGIGLELDRTYCEVAIKRIAEVSE